jgi:hypothetical protein
MLIPVVSVPPNPKLHQVVRGKTGKNNVHNAIHWMEWLMDPAAVDLVGLALVGLVEVKHS